MQTQPIPKLSRFYSCFIYEVAFYKTENNLHEQADFFKQKAKEIELKDKQLTELEFNDYFNKYKNRSERLNHSLLLIDLFYFTGLNKEKLIEKYSGLNGLENLLSNLNS